jgi:hypothetical protein
VSLMESVGPQLAADNSDGAAIRLLGRELDIDGISPSLWAFFEKQIRRMEQALFEHTRPEVESYLQGFIRRAGLQRTVGRETGANAVADD